MNENFSKKNKIIHICLVIVLIIIFGVLCFVLGTKYKDIVQNIENDNKVQTDEEISIGSLGKQQTSIEGDLSENDIEKWTFINLNIEEDGTVSAKNNEIGKDMFVSGINEKAIRIVKTYSCDSLGFEIAVLSEKGNIYIFNSNEGIELNSEKINFTKLDSSIIFYGIDTEAAEGEMITCSYSNIFAYDKNKNKYKIWISFENGQSNQNVEKVN